MKEQKIKSIAIIAIKKYIIEHFGEDVYKKILDKMSKDNRQIIENLVTISQWCPVEAVKEFCLAAEAILSFYGNPKDIFYDIGHVAAIEDLPNFYKPLIRLLDVNFTLKATTKLWRLYHTHGEVRVERAGEKSVYAYLDNFPTSYKATCWNTASYFHGIVELSGFALAEPVKEIECVLEGGKCCTFFIAWL